MGNFIKKLFNQLGQNWASWLSVSIISIPLSIPLAVASWSSPIAWILTAIWAWFIASIFWWSKYNIVWPAGALSALLLQFVIKTDVLLLPVLAIVVWIFILLFYFFRVTKYLALIPSTALHWFIMWVWLTIAATQINNALWLVWLPKHESFFMNVSETFSHIWNTNLVIFWVFLVWFVLSIFWKRLFPKVPSVIPVSVIWIIVWFLDKWWVINLWLKTLWDQFPTLKFMIWDFAYISNLWSADVLLKHWPTLISAWFVIAIIWLLETLISAKIADKATKTKFNQQKETLWLALANIVSWLMWWLPASWVFLRTAVNIKSGATSARSQWISAVLITLISALLFWYFKYLPMATVASILMAVALWMIDLSLLKKLYKLEKRSFIICVWVAILTLLFDPMIALAFWVWIALIVHINQTMDTDIMLVWESEDIILPFRKCALLSKQDIIKIYLPWEITFMNAEKIKLQLEKTMCTQKIILSFSNVFMIDVDWLEIIEEIIEEIKKKKIWLELRDLNEDCAAMLKKSNIEFKEEKHL